ncbi:DM13 domain-containing protein [Nitrosopumilus maritimus]|uniref:Secreted protein n=1 Tax=Nitrosopumilus maritimus (strain SCM1) TaxID=436308 RepID=A9A5A5_NITMS|nr:DM13 domain-containing protein [Nitrosopumilus maritimus]ABX12304.1 secreted protein [Nitrosopumilus maritimus SCM1]
MNKYLIPIIAIAIVGSVSAFAISPYFTESSIDEALPTGAVVQPMMEETMMEKMTPVSYSGTFIGVGDGIHDAQGDAYTIPLEDGSDVLRLENFQSTNGPDLYVYLATDDDASEFINLGELKANKGNQNYEIPDDADLTKYNKVLIWCQAFSVLFGSAELS